ncbi:hypothetical protein HOY80DRAFT_1135925 [Tuber brumale]|nr:hypothetical protein HOY80DRAFT_1135925 [Tuber brumale]
MDSDGALGSDKDELPLFQLLGSSTTKAGINATRELKVVDDSRSNVEPRTDIDNEAILKEQRDSNKIDTSDVVSDLLSHNKHGGGVVVAFANSSKAFKADTKKGTGVKRQQNTSDSLLGVRIILLKAIVPSNSRPAVAHSAPSLQPEPEPYKTTEDAALNLWNTLTALR